MNKENLTLTEGKTEQLTATVLPEDATDKTVTWSSDNTDAATVDENGNITAVAKGTAIITAQAGNVSSSCTVKVEVATVEWVEEPQYGIFTMLIKGKVDTSKVNDIKAFCNEIELNTVEFNLDGTFVIDVKDFNPGDKIIVKAYDQNSNIVNSKEFIRGL